MFNLHNVFQESNSGVKQDLPVHCTEKKKNIYIYIYIYILYMQYRYTLQVHMPVSDIVTSYVG